ncbi:Inner membrane protein YedI [Pseudomonas koreensis]|nr:Inner membrane protein YedI [Pseudomonas koreensis]
MAGSSLLVLIDDIATVLDDVALMTKMAAKKTAGVLGDDLALNAQQVSGVRAEREIPVVWAVAKGSFVNKLILVPSALAISAFVPWLVTPLLMVGGAYLCFEGFEKLAHKFLHSKEEDEAEHTQLTEAVADPATDLVAFEKDKIKGAIRTDFILSAEIIAITLGTVADASLTQQVVVMSGIAIVMTVGVYGLVAGIVKLDDLGLWLTQKPGQMAKKIGGGILSAAPYMMKTLSVVGTAAMFLVGGGILTHGVPVLHHWIEGVGAAAGSAGFAVPMLLNGVAGIIAGAAVLAVISVVGKLWKALKG